MRDTSPSEHVEARVRYDSGAPKAQESLGRQSTCTAQRAGQKGPAATMDAVGTLADTALPPSGNTPPKRMFVLCPGGVVTGGPEALHQLVHVARKLGADAQIAYVRPESDQVPVEYQCYDTPIAEIVDDSAECVVVVPEIWSDMLRGFTKAKRVFWWLSWDYGRDRFDEARAEGVEHAFQSKYAHDMGLSLGLELANVSMLGDFVSDAFRVSSTDTPKQDSVAYFPAKDEQLVSRISAAAPDIKFVRLEQMTRTEVHQTLRECKVYVDFGAHPGKDRVPREAVMSGCCVVTASDRGAAAYLEDVPIPHQYKLPTQEFNPFEAVGLLRRCLKHYDELQSDFDYYRYQVGAEPFLFEEQVYLLLRKLGWQDLTS